MGVATPGDDGLQDDLVERWLKKHCVLQSLEAVQQAAGGAARAAASNPNYDTEGEEGEADDREQQPCEICGRRYYHEHIRSMYAAPDEGTESDEGS